MEDFDNEYDEAMSDINEIFGKYRGEQSGWVLDEIRAINLNVARYNPIRGASYIKTPKAIEVENTVYWLFSSQTRKMLKRLSLTINFFTN